MNHIHTCEMVAYTSQSDETVQVVKPCYANNESILHIYMYKVSCSDPPYGMSRDRWGKINFRNRSGLIWLGLEQYWKFIAGSSLCSARFASSSLSSNSYSLPYSIELEFYKQGK